MNYPEPTEADLLQIAKMLQMDGKEDFLEMARAAIEAMRTMPPGMLSYLQMNTEIGAYVCANWAGAYSCMEEYHSKMIDAALKD